MRNDKNLDDGYVYFIQCGDGGPIKIGYSKHASAESRLTTAQVYNPVLLTLVAVIPGGRRKEQELHSLYASHNIQGEWFAPNDELITLIDSQNRLNLTVNDFRRKGPHYNTHHFWKGSEATNESKRARAQRQHKIAPGQKCQVCGIKDAIDRYHKDGQLDNVSLENILLVCRSCCMELDGRLEALKALNKCPRGYHQNPRPKKPPEPCIICGQLSKPLRKGRCHACNEYFRRRGRERSEILKAA